MGLDITAYRGLAKLDVTFTEDNEPMLRGTDEVMDYDDYCKPFLNPSFLAQCAGLEDNVVYSFADSMGFRAGSYSGYGQFRNMLAQFAGYADSHGAWNADSGPFWELINFSDCEGSIGPVVSLKLANDFKVNQERADKHPSEYFREMYTVWREAFEMAADNGMVDFH